MVQKKNIVRIAIVILAVLILFITTALPILVKSKAIEAIQAATGRNVRIEKVSLNPFTLTASIKGFVIEERGGGPFISISQARVSLSLALVYRRALVLSRVSIESPSISIVRTGPGTFSFADIMARQQADKKPKSTGMFPFSLHNITLTHGSLDFIDQAVEGGRKHTIRDLEIAIPFISSIPSLVEKDTNPRISALINGSPFTLTGKMKPFSKSLETSLHIVLTQFNLPELLVYAPQAPSVDLTSGKLTLDTEVSYRTSPEQKPELTVKGRTKLDDINLNLKQGQPLVKLPSLEIQAAKLDVFAQKFDIETITLDRPELFISRNSRGEWIYERMLKRKDEMQPAPLRGKESGQAGNAEGQVFSVGSLELRQGSVHFRDGVPKSGFKTSVSEINLALKKFTNVPEQFAEYVLSLLLDNEVTVTSAGSFSIVSPEAKATVKLAGLKLQKGWPYLAQFLTAPLQGSLDLAGDVAFSKERGLIAENGRLALKNLSARYGEKEGLELALVTANGAIFRQKENSLEIAEIRFSQGNISLSREADGMISVQSLLVPQENNHAQPPGISSPSPAQKKTAPTGKEDAKPFTYRLKRLQLDKFNAAFSDKSRRGNPRFTLRDTTLSLRNLNGPAFTPAQFHFTSTFGKETPLKAGGEITPLPFRFRGDIGIGRLPIRDFEGYFPENLNVFIVGGSLDTAMKLDIALKDGTPMGSFEGNAGISAFHAIDSVAEEDLLKWERFQLDEIRGNLKPFSLAIGQLALNGPYARIIVREDGTLNLQNLVRKEEETKALSPAPTINADTPAPPQKTEPSKTSIGAITILDGTISFTDNHLPQHFASTFYNLGGRISGLTSEEMLADVDLRGNLENHSPLQITGKINPLRDDLFIDLKVSFNDIELSPLTPYTGTYLGYTVEKGKLFLDLKYHIEKKELNSENKILIDQFTFGEKVESDKATSLPVKLGLALLKDRQGEIHLDVPVTGRTDDPQFSIWSLIFQVLKNLLVKAITSPFALLSSIFGGGTDLSVIPFAPGMSTLQPPEEQQLSSLAKGLNERPALKMELTAYVDREKDAEGYRIELLNRKVRNEKFLALAKGRQIEEGTSMDKITLLPEEYSTYLKAVYGKEKFPKPRNVLGMVMDLPDSEMSKLIIAHTVVGDSELQALAHERVAAVMDYLVKQGNIQPERIFLKSDDIFKPPEKDKTAGSRVMLNAIAQ